METFHLQFHLPYRCRHSGRCCTSRWPIPVERDRVREIERALPPPVAAGTRASWLEQPPGTPDDVAGVLALTPSGACVFHRVSPGAVATDASPGCAIHPVRPASCAHFPYACVIDPRGVHVTLSHYCPTAAALLFDEGAAEIVPGPPIFPDGRVPEGLDARGGLPPTADVQMTPSAADAQTAREAADVQMTPSAADAQTIRLAGAVTGGGRWRVGSGARRRPRLLSWDEVTRWERDCVHAVAADWTLPPPPSLAGFDRVRAAASAEWAWPAAPDDVVRIWAASVAPGWLVWTPVIGRYLAAKVVASWAMHLGRGPVDVLTSVALARTVLQVESARLCEATGRPLDRELLTEAIRQADRLLMHHADARLMYGRG